MRKINSQGFSLIEVMVVISIITLLASVILTGTVTAREKARIASILNFEKSLFDSFGADAVGYWQMSEGNGFNVSNLGSSNGGRPGIASNVGWTPDGPSGRQSLIFGTSSSQVSVGTITIPVPGMIAAWARWGSGTNEQAIFSNRASGGFLTFTCLNGYFYVYNASATPQYISASRNLNDGKWHYLVWSYSGTTVQLYIDGKKEAETNMTMVPTTGDAYIGRDPQVPTNYWTGSIAGVAVYSGSIQP